MHPVTEARIILDVVEAGHRDPTAITELNRAFLALANPTRDIPAEQWTRAYRLIKDNHQKEAAA